MKILAITAYYPPHHAGGYELRCKEVLEGLRQRGHEVLLLTSQCPAGPRCDAHPGEAGVARRLHLRFEHTPVLSQIIRDCRDTAQIERAIKDFQPDLVYLWHIQNLSNAILPYFAHQDLPIAFDEGSSGLIYLAKVHRRGIYFYQNERDFVVKKLLKKSIYAFARLASANRIKTAWAWPKNMGVYFNCRSSLEYARLQGVQIDAAQVIYSGIDLSKFAYVANGRLTPPVKIIAPGRIKEQKGLIDAVRLVKELAERKISAALIIAGAVQSEPCHQELLHEIDAHGLGDAVQVCPMLPQGELSRLYRNSDFCFFPSYQRYGFSRIPLEAMASGCVVIAYGNEGSNEIISTGENGILVPEGDFEAAAAQVEKLTHDPALYKTISQNARQKVEQNHSMSHYLDLVEEFLQLSFLENSSPGQPFLSSSATYHTL